jgi:alanine racemase
VDAAAETRTDPTTTFGPWIEVNREHLTHNVEQVSRRVSGRPILAVIKGDAYGHGLTGTARHLESLRSVYGFAVFKVDEALSLRDAGITKPVLVLGPATDEELEALVHRDVMPSIYEDRGVVLARLASELGKRVKVHLYVDTGLGRTGVPYYRALPLLDSLAAHEGIEFDGVLTALTEDPEFDREQLRRLNELHAEAEDRGLDLGRRHAASSSGVFHLPEAHLDMVRPGVAIYGCYPGNPDVERGEMTLEPAMSLKARVMLVKQLRTGDSLQYHRAYVAERPVWVATLPVGYSDGLPRGTVDTCSVLIGGRRYPLVAGVTSNHSLIEIGDEPTVAVGEEALFFGSTVGGSIDPHEVADRASVSVYSLLIGINPLLPRVYI